MKRLALLFALLLVYCGAFAQVFTTEFEGVERRYKMYLPKDLKPDAPLVMVLHGSGAKIEHVENKGFSEAAEKYGFAVCYPQGSEDRKSVV